MIPVSSDTSDIRIRPYQEDDVERLYEAARESVADMQPWMPWCHADYSRKDAEAWVVANCRPAEGQGDTNFVIESIAGRLLGGCGLNRLDPSHRTANLGYWLRTSARGRGAATSATTLVRDHAFDNTHLDRLEIVVAVGNSASQRVAVRAGAVREGLLRQALLLNDQRHDAILYSLLRSDPTQ